MPKKHNTADIPPGRGSTTQSSTRTPPFFNTVLFCKAHGTSKACTSQTTGNPPHELPSIMTSQHYPFCRTVISQASSTVVLSIPSSTRNTLILENQQGIPTVQECSFLRDLEMTTQRTIFCSMIQPGAALCYNIKGHQQVEPPTKRQDTYP